MNVEVASSLQHSSSAEESMDYEQEASSIPWRYLPAPALETIYCYLNREDQSSMSQVCKNWSTEYSSPSLWREITFNLSEHALTTEIHPAVRSAQRFGQYFHHVQVVGSFFFFILSTNGDRLDPIGKQLKLFLQILANKSQLHSISFHEIREEVFQGVHQSLIDLLMTQNKLQSVEFQYTYFEKSLAMDVIQTVFSKNSRTLKNLDLTGFIGRSSNVNLGHTTINVPLTLETLMNLETLTIDYSYYFEDIITSIYEHRSELLLRGSGNLKKIHLFHLQIGSFIFDGIQPAAWSFFRKIFPALKLYFTLEVWRQTELACISRHMPVSRLDIKWYRLFTDHFELGTLLRQVTECEIDEDLEILHVRVKNGGDRDLNLFQDIWNFLLVSPKLKQLHLNFTSRVNDLNDIFDYWLDNGPMSLKTVSIKLPNVSDRELRSNYINLAYQYAPLLRELGFRLALFI